MFLSIHCTYRISQYWWKKKKEFPELKKVLSIQDIIENKNDQNGYI
jgi:hypothetical protein